jgi:hypothetical protein
VVVARDEVLILVIDGRGRLIASRKGSVSGCMFFWYCHQPVVVMPTLMPSLHLLVVLGFPPARRW